MARRKVTQGPVRVGAVASPGPSRQAKLQATGSETKPAWLENWQGAKLKPLGLTVAAGVALAAIPTPQGVTTQAWNLLSIFVATIIGIITQPVPLGAVAMTALGMTMWTGTLPFSAAFSAFSNEIPWLIALSFFLARGFIKTGLGNRIAYLIVRAFGRSTLGLTYSLVFSERYWRQPSPLLPRAPAASSSRWHGLSARRAAPRRPTERRGRWARTSW